MSGSERGDEKPAAAKQLGAHRLLYDFVFSRKGSTEDANVARNINGLMLSCRNVEWLKGWASYRAEETRQRS
jgi:hypothetical protein